MKTTKQLMQIIQSNGITYNIGPLPSTLLGYYQHSSSGFYILMNSSLDEESELFKCVLAEEIGHYFTTIGINEPKTYNTYRIKLSVSKEEEKALLWACNYLISTNLLLSFLSENIYARKEDLVDHFQVTEEFMIQKLAFMARKNLYWHIKDNYYLCLSSLPSVYIFTSFDDSLTDKI